MNGIVCVYSDVVLTELNKKQIKINCKNGFFICNIYYLNLIQNYLAIERRKKINFLRETIFDFIVKIIIRKFINWIMRFVTKLIKRILAYIIDILSMKRKIYKDNCQYITWYRTSKNFVLNIYNMWFFVLIQIVNK